jgi:aspartate aminotransferase-like enzyme
VIRENSESLVCVDGVSSVGGLELRFDEWGIDACASASQKGYMVPPGLAFVALSERAVQAMEGSTIPKFYLDLRKALTSLQTNDTPWTPAISLLMGLDRALERMRQEGMEAIWQRHRMLGRAMRTGVQALGLRLFSRYPSDTVTAVWLPEGLTWGELNRALREDHGMTCAGGQGPYAGKIFRVAHLGFVDRTDILAFLAALGSALNRCGWRCKAEAAIEAAIGEGVSPRHK